MLRASFLAFALSSVGCAPGTSARDANDANDVARTTFTATVASKVSSSDLRRTVCGLVPSVPVGGERRDVGVWVDGYPCESSVSARALRLEVSRRGGVVHLEMSAPIASAPGEIADVERGLDEIRAELDRRTQPGPVTTSRRSQKLLGASIVFGSIALLAATAGGITVGIGLGARRGGNPNILAAGGGVLGIVAGPTLLASIITLHIASNNARKGN